MKELSKQTLKYLYRMRSLDPNLYKKMITKIDVSDEMILLKVADISDEERDDYCLYQMKKEINPDKKSDDKWNRVCYLGGKPYLSDKTVTQKAKYVSSNRISCAPSKTCDKGYIKKHRRKTVLKKVSMFIDAENIPAKYAEEIIKKVSKEGKIIEKKYYTLKNDKTTRPWHEAKEEYNLINISIDGEPEKNKIDNSIKGDVKQILNNDKFDAICIVASDSGYIDIVNEIKKSGKEAIIVGEEKTPAKLRNAVTTFIELSSGRNKSGVDLII